MFNFLFLPAFLIHHTITFGLSNWIKPKNTISLSIISNSLVVSSGSYLFLNNYISKITMMNIFQFTLGFFANEFLFKYYYNINKDRTLKIIHHIIATIGIYKFQVRPELMTILFFTEVTNIPLEIRNICKSYNYNRFYIQYVMISLLYVGFAYLRIYLAPVLSIQNYQRNNLSFTELNIFLGIYLLWIFWFYKINYIIYRKVKNYLHHKNPQIK